MTYYKTISHTAARELILAHRLQGWGRTFSVAWIHRTTSEDGQREEQQLEVLTGRFGVRKHLRSRRGEGQAEAAGPYSGAAYDRHAHGLFCVYATSRKYAGKSERIGGYRCIPFDGLRWLLIDGTTYKIGAAPAPQH